MTLTYTGKPKGAGLVVEYTATATDAVDGAVTAVCDPPSGTRLGLGTTTVECSVTDDAGNQTTGTFTVTIGTVSDGGGKGGGGRPPKG